MNWSMPSQRNSWWGQALTLSWYRAAGNAAAAAALWPCSSGRERETARIRDILDRHTLVRKLTVFFSPWRNNEVTFTAELQILAQGVVKKPSHTVPAVSSLLTATGCKYYPRDGLILCTKLFYFNSYNVLKLKSCINIFLYYK